MNIIGERIETEDGTINWKKVLNIDFKGDPDKIIVGTKGEMESGENLQEVFHNPDKQEQKAMRFNEGKLQWSLVHFKSLWPLVKVLMFGAKKYSPHNWKKPMDRKEILESSMRHLTAMMDGEENDPESGLPHEGHIQCNMMFYNFHSEREKTEVVK